MPERVKIREVVDALEGLGAAPAAPPAGTPFEQVLYEIASYLVPDERRLEVHRRLEREVGLTPDAILRAPRARLLAAIEDGGMKPEMRADRVREAAQTAKEIGDLSKAAKKPLPEAVKAFARFPSVGLPGAEKILLFAGAHAVPALESNGLRTLERLGFAPGGRSYAATYRTVRESLLSEGAQTARFWQKAHLLLRRHGQEICRRTAPLCRLCPLAPRCPVGRPRVGATTGPRE
jgi:endonuclease-3